MEIFLCTESALAVWRSPLGDMLRGQPPRRLRTLPADTITPPLSMLDALHALCPGADPIDVLVGSPNTVRKTPGFRTHVWSRPLPDGAFIRVDDAISVASPNFCLLQLAARMDPAEHIQVGFELCSTYSLLPYGTGFVTRDTPLTSRNSVLRYLDALPGAYGVKKARRNLRWLSDRAASPMETRLALQLQLPTQLGGYRFPRAELNHRYELSARARRETGTRYFKGDVCWPSLDMLMEYNSDAFHTGPDRIAADARRMNSLIDRKLTPFVVTKQQLLDVREFDKVVRQLHRAAHRPYREPTAPQWRAKYHLHHQLNRQLHPHGDDKHPDEGLNRASESGDK